MKKNSRKKHTVDIFNAYINFQQNCINNIWQTFFSTWKFDRLITTPCFTNSGGLNLYYFYFFLLENVPLFRHFLKINVIYIFKTPFLDYNIKRSVFEWGRQSAGACKLIERGGCWIDLCNLGVQLLPKTWNRIHLVKLQILS